MSPRTWSSRLPERTEFNAIGYCLGGTPVEHHSGLYENKGDSRIRSATYFTTMIDFSEPGELGVFIDEEQISSLEERMNKEGFLEGSRWQVPST